MKGSYSEHSICRGNGKCCCFSGITIDFSNDRGRVVRIQHAEYNSKSRQTLRKGLGLFELALDPMLHLML
ncbi:hypothetical protein L1987_04659 [Smallanthus sonchifolius]|uniref:Uncharacterized protein n=1 Tax=Smallanthus sonchifolius TaxID=185202 RepID=A0ACB9JT69_9ASTR|nr:hypothetical protein L1987_04659 [Smallanthus sonchifolius]